MNPEPTSRLEQALAAFLDYRAGVATREELLADRAELRDLLEPMFAAERASSAAPQLAPQTAEAGAETARRRLGDYDVIGELGRGGMGVVFEGRHRSLGSRVAIKVMAEHLASRPAQTARFLREARTLARLDHPGIVRVHDAGTDAGQHWLSMDFVDGESLEARIARLRADGGHRGGSLRALVHVALEIAEALDHAHRHGIVHRDVKPSNVFVRPDGSAVLIDFGLAHDAELPTVTMSGAFVGTPHYLAPERLRDGVVDARTDVFGLGVTLYEMLTLERAFDGPTMEVVLHRVLHAEPRAPRAIARDLPEDLSAIVQLAIEKDPRRRYQTAAELAADLRAFLELRAVRARHSSMFARVLRWARREPLRAALVAMLAVGVPTVAALVGYVVARQPAIEAGEQRLVLERVERGLARGFAHLARLDIDAGFRAPFDDVLSVAPGRVEAIVGIAFGLEATAGAAAALEYLEGVASSASEPALRRMREYLAIEAGGRAPTPEEIAAFGAPVDAADHLVAGHVRFAAAEATRDEAGIADALRILARGERLWPEPNVAHLTEWARVAKRAGDADSQRECGAVLERHFADQPSVLGTLSNLLASSDPAAASAAAERAIDLEPDYAPWRFNLAMKLFEAGREDDALAEIERAIELDPSHYRSLVQRGVILHDKGRLDEAAASLERAVELEPESGHGWYNLAIVSYRRGDPDRALLGLQHAVRLMPDEASAHQSLCNLLESTGRLGELQAEKARWAAR